MSGRRCAGGLLAGLALFGVMLIGTAGTQENGAPAALPGPAGWTRVDGQDHDLDEMLSLMRPPKAETLAIFAPPQSWKPFYDKIYGRDPIDLDLYAVLYSLSPGGPDPPSLSGWPSFYQETPPKAEAAATDRSVPDPAQPRRELLGQPSSEAVTFKTTIFPATAEELQTPENDRGGKTTYTAIATLIPARQQEMFFLNLFQTDPDDPVELERLALEWRAEFLEALTRAEEYPSEQNLE